MYLILNLIFKGLFGDGINLSHFPNLQHLYCRSSRFDADLDFQCDTAMTLKTIKITNHPKYNSVIAINPSSCESLSIHIPIYSLPTPIELNQLLNLKHLFITDNSGKCLFSLKYLTELVRLVLIHCDIAEENFFENLTKLEYLSLTSVKNLKMESAFQNMPKLVKLDLKDNNIKVLGSFSTFKCLKFLDMSYNKIKKLDTNVFDGLGQLEYLSLKRNPLEADSIINLENFQKLNKTRIVVDF